MAHGKIPMRGERGEGNCGCGKRLQHGGRMKEIVKSFLWAICFPLPKARTSVDGVLISIL